MADKLGMKVLFDYKKSYEELQQVINKLSKEKVNIPINFNNGSSSGSSVSGKTGSAKPIKEMSQAVLELQNNLNSLGHFDIANTPIEKGLKIIGYSTKELGNNFESFSQSLNNGQNQIVTYSGTINKLTGNINITGKAIRQTARENNTFSKELGIAIKRTIEWSIAVGGWYKTLRSFKEGIKFIYELSNQMNEIRIVTGKTADEAGRLSKEYNKLAQSMGVATKEFASATVEFYRQGLNEDEVMKRSATTTKYAKVANEDFKQSAEILTAVVNSMGIDIEKASDIMLYMGDATATSAGEIGRAMQKVAGSAGALKIPFEKMASYISVISSRTRESAESIGTSMKALLARFQNIVETGYNEEDSTKINDVAKALKTVGIAFTDSEGEIRRFDIVIEELGKKWNLLDSTTRAYLSTVLAGTRQQSRFYNLMDGLQEATDLYNKSLLAANTTQDKFNIYLESNEAKLNKFKSRMEEMWLNTFNDKSLGKLIEFGTGVVSLVDNIGILNIAIVAAGTAFVVYIDKVGKAILAFKKLNPEVLIAIACITALMYAVGKYNEHQKQMYENAVNNAKALSEETRKNTDLMNSISDLYDKQKLSNDERDRLKTVQAELQKMYPDVLNNLDLEKISYEDLERAVRNVTDAKKEQVLADLQLQRSKLELKRDSLQWVEDTTLKWGFYEEDNLSYNKEREEISRQIAELDALKADILLGAYDNSDIEEDRLKRLNKVPSDKKPPKNPPDGKTDLEKAYQSYYNTIRDLNFELDRQNEILQQKEGLDQIPILSDINDKLETQKSNLHAINEARREELAKLSPTSERYQELIEKIQDTSLEWWKLDNQQKSNIKNIEKIREEQEKLIENQIKETVELEKKLKLQEVENKLKQELIDLEKEIYGTTQKAWEEASNARIEELEDELELLDKKNEKEKEAEERSKKLLEIQKQQEKLNNIKNERNVRMLTESGWQWVSDPRAIQQETDRLKDLQADYEDWEDQNRLNRKRKKIQDQIEEERELQKIKKQSYDKQKEDLENAYKLQKIQIDVEYRDIDSIVAERMEDIKATQNEKLGEMLTDAYDRLKELKRLYNQALDLQAKIEEIEIKSSSSGTNFRDIVLKGNPKTFDTGGFTGNSKGLAWLDKKEIVLNKLDTENLLKAVELTRNIVQSFRIPQLSPAGVGGGVSPIYNLHIDKVVTEDANSFVDLLPTLVHQYK